MRYFRDNLKQITFGIFLVILIILSRTTFHFAHNVEFVTFVGFAGGYFLKSKIQSFVFLFAGILLSDLIIGNTNIFIFTWTGFLIPWFLGLLFKRFVIFKKFESIDLFSKSFASGFLSTLLFFLWTNFGVVIVTTMYSKDIVGILNSYINGLPFLQNQLIGNLVLLPLLVVLLGQTKYLKEFSRNRVVINEENFEIT